MGWIQEKLCIKLPVCRVFEAHGVEDFAGRLRVPSGLSGPAAVLSPHGVEKFGLADPIAALFFDSDPFALLG